MNIVLITIGTVLFAGGIIFLAAKAWNKNLILFIIIIVMVGSILATVGAGGLTQMATIGTPLPFSELKESQNYTQKTIPNGWRIVKMDSAQSEEDGWKVVKDFPADFDFSKKDFTKY